MRSRVMAVVGLFLAFWWCGEAQAGPLAGVTNDAWDVSNGTVVTATTGVILGDATKANMFGRVGGPEAASTLFRDWRVAGTVHAIEWQSTSALTIRSFDLSAYHDSFGARPRFPSDLSNPTQRDANQRGFDRFTLRAWNSSTSAFDMVLYDSAIPLGGPTPGSPFKFYDPLGLLSLNTTSLNMNILDLKANVTAFSTDRWRAEFTQVGLPSSESGPRIVELDGFTTSLPVAPVPEPGSLALLGSALAFGVWLRGRKNRRVG